MSSRLCDTVDGEVAGLLLARDRRDFHRYAESGWTEFRTSSLIARRLVQLGWTVHAGRDVCSAPSRMGLPPADELERHRSRALAQGGDTEYVNAAAGGFTGVVGTLRRGSGPTIALRFDIDALDLVESDSASHRPAREGFASINVGVCHACGHDGHAAAGLGVAAVLSKLQDDLCGTVKLIFQPAEEGVRGARSIVEAGHLDDVDALIGHHLFTGWAVGDVAAAMNGYAATRKFDAAFEGQPAHAGGCPEGGRNALLAAATAAIGLHALPRHQAGFTRVNVGRLDAGTGRNVIPDRSLLVGEVRGETTALCESMYQRAVRVIESAAAMYGCEVAIRPMGAAGTAACDASLIERAESAATRIGASAARSVDRMGGSEDFTEMMRHVQARGGWATYLGIGADLVPAGGHGTADGSRTLDGHTGVFDFDERALDVGVRLLTALTFDLVSDPLPRKTKPEASPLDLK